jgi:hypothetical protein
MAGTFTCSHPMGLLSLGQIKGRSLQNETPYGRRFQGTHLGKYSEIPQEETFLVELQHI